jgi:SAM-dependent MidA family methyltransferase
MTSGRRPSRTELPPSSAGEAARESFESDRPRLADLISSEIEAAPGRRITFARFMERALYEPELGYYRVADDRPTGSGDFLTAPETHAIFGWTVARRIEALWVELGRPRPFGLVEYGAGSGTLALSILDGFRRHGADELLAAVRYEPVESNPHRIADLRRRFDEAGLTELLAGTRPDGVAGTDGAKGANATAGSIAGARPHAGADSAAVAGLPSGVESEPVFGVLLANEFLDALPVHRVVVRDGKLAEIFVARRDGSRGDGSRGEVPATAPMVAGTPAASSSGAASSSVAASSSGAAEFVEVTADPSTPELARRLADDGVTLAEGQVAEICLGLVPWLRDAAARIDRGFVIAIDYGFAAHELYGPRRLAGTLLGYSSHRVVENPLVDPGLVDITAHVDFSAVARLAADSGFEAVSLETQSDFLVAAGLELELRALQSSPDLSLADYTRARSGIVRLLDPRHMGRFRVLVLRGPGEGGRC